MATVKAISVTYGRKLNLGDYNQAHLEITLEAELVPGESLENATADLWRDAKESVKQQAMPLIKQQQARAETAFAGLPADVQNKVSGAR